MRFFLVIFSVLIICGCDDLNSRPSAKLSGLQSSSLLKIIDESVIPETEFSIVFTPDSEVEIIDAHIEGVDMYMGKIPLFFSRNKQMQYTASGMVGVCSKKEMVWRIYLHYRKNGSQEGKIATLNFVVTNT
ncbi:hypothetical protein [Pseudoalteromonas sp. G4]|uniref:hypothetical protein n=1 Tax=Pseudoalteromonas sp. G4 TaxID=2992761 RepID=UPI00237DF087|nr:hypothetical protein [Pseudoalteromonas sp. G4]MDE3270708.1 hypothetical protein [Pseudoalteromonas sp. G4]